MKTENFILLPKRGLRARTAGAREIFRSVPDHGRDLVLPQGQLARVVDRCGDDGPVLVRMRAGDALLLNEWDESLRALPLLQHGLPLGDPFALVAGTARSAFARGRAEGSRAAIRRALPFAVRVRDAATGEPLAEVQVFAVCNGEVSVASTDGVGVARLAVAAPRISELYCMAHPCAGYRTAVRRELDAADAAEVMLPRVALPCIDPLRFYYGESRFDDSSGVRVAIVDTGVGPHADLHVAGGCNAVPGEDPARHEDGHWHGTHVAGLVGARSNALRGVAPGVELFAARIFGDGGSAATSWSVTKALAAVADAACDVAVLGLGSGPFDVAIAEAVSDARDHGCLVFLPAGPDTDACPAFYDGVVGVAAFGRSDEGEPHRRRARARYDALVSRAAVTAPGTGIVSTLPCHRYGELSGSSLAAGGVGGAAASLLSRRREILEMPRNIARAAAVETLLLDNCIERASGMYYPDPARV